MPRLSRYFFFILSVFTKNKWAEEELAVKQFRKGKAAHVFCQDVKGKRMQTFAQPHCLTF